MTATSSRFLFAAIGSVSLTILAEALLERDSYAQSNDPCAATASLSVLNGRPAAPAQADGREPKRRPLDHDDRWRHLDGLYAHRAAVARERVAQTSLESS